MIAAVVAPLGACKTCHSDDESEEAEERDQQRDNWWRVQVAVTGRGTVTSKDGLIHCSFDEKAGPRACGPVLFRFKELKPPLLDGQPAEGWRLDHWESSVRERDGAVAPRKGPMPDGRYYINGFGYEDTGQLETVTAVFVERSDAKPPPGPRP